jgi:hypothetical protein
VGMDASTGATRPIPEAELEQLAQRLGRPIQFGDRHPDTGEVIVSGEVAHAQQVGRSELNRRERRAEERRRRREAKRAARSR